MANEPLDQIKKKQYDQQLQDAGVHEIILFGAAFSGKLVEIISA